MDARAISVVLMSVLAAVPALAAPAERRFTVVHGHHKKLTKKQIIIVVSVVGGVIGLILIGLIIFIIWVKFDIGEKIRDRFLDWRMKRMVAKAVDEVVKELEAMPDPPSTATATAQPNSSSPLNDNSRDQLVVPSSPKSKAATEASTQSENQQQQPPPYTETADIAMPEPAHIQSQLDPNAPMPYTRELPPQVEGRKGNVI
ncbi:hypothetical protein FRC04_009287 [Tulasnella sp. 424]|nr:hypothetical protein FRC04_009287 [Tulasnella sp. 424]KAG8973106.1 hypothetical protein FRC05_009116 [Tulasnella sp. 425]